jgi:DnaJ-class molecular chaperone
MIKDAYRSLAKRHHPDVQGDSSDHVPDIEKFRDIVEAYSVLSVKESRATFDLSRRKNPKKYEQMSEEQFNMNNRRDLRNSDGNITR